MSRLKKTNKQQNNIKKTEKATLRMKAEANENKYANGH